MHAPYTAHIRRAAGYGSAVAHRRKVTSKASLSCGEWGRAVAVMAMGGRRLRSAVMSGRSSWAPVQGGSVAVRVAAEWLWWWAGASL